MVREGRNVVIMTVERLGTPGSGLLERTIPSENRKRSRET
jgi:hypothetical protein